MDNYGSVSLDGRHWVVQCEPHVRSRLKRVFPRAPQHAAESLRISRSPENSRELAWFLQRYPMVVDRMADLEADAVEHRRQQRTLADILANVEPPPKVELERPPRDYQMTVPQVLKIRHGLLLADDLGLGKTVSAICCLTDPTLLPAVIVMPPNLLTQWAAVLADFAPGLKVEMIKDGKPRDLVKQAKGRQKELLPARHPDVVLVSYFRLRKWADHLSTIAKLVVFEECQQLRRPGTEIYSACQMMAAAASARLGLSATPIFNYGNEFFHVVDVLTPDCLGDYNEFSREWCGSDGRIKNTREFGAYLRREGIMLRRTRAEVGRELPKLTKVVMEVEADSRVIDQMTGDAVALARIILGKSESYRGERMQAAGEFDLIVRQATGIAKAPYVAEMVRLLCESGEKVLLFGWHRAVYDIWNEKLKDLKPVMYTGSEDAKAKAASVDAFVRGDSQILIMSLRAGIGVDELQKVCRVTVHGELDWSPAVLEQNIGRVNRDGQEHEVMSYFLVAEEGSDPVMTDVLGIKRDQIEGVRNPDLALTERIDTGENNLRQLARQLLERRGLPVEEAA